MGSIVLIIYGIEGNFGFEIEIKMMKFIVDVVISFELNFLRLFEGVILLYVEKWYCDR